MKLDQSHSDFFGLDYLRLNQPFLTEEKTQRETEAILFILGLPTGSKLLDLCCGYGRHSLQLAAAGFQVSGLDVNEGFLEIARRDANEAGTEIRWLCSDMRVIPYMNEFDAVINIFNAFGYLENSAEDQKVLDAVNRALKPGGLFLIDTINRDAMIHGFIPESITRYPDGMILLEERQIDILTSCGTIQQEILFPEGNRHCHTMIIRLYSLTELAGMLHRAGFELLDYYGGFDRTPLTWATKQMILLARKLLP
jgi:SAM-dependent methyltransferase